MDKCCGGSGMKAEISVSMSIDDHWSWERPGGKLRLMLKLPRSSSAWGFESEYWLHMAPGRAQSLRGLPLCWELEPEDELVLVSSPGKRKSGLSSRGSTMPSDFEDSGFMEDIDVSGDSEGWCERVGEGNSMFEELHGLEGGAF
jgi:hypothetical protein